MSHQLATIVLVALGAVLVIAGLLCFVRPRWLVGWLAGTAVFGVILVGLYTLTVALNLAGYQSAGGLRTVATIATQRQSDQVWRVTVQSENGLSTARTVQGDQWQIDVRILRFSGPIRWLGIDPGFRLEQLSGRYTSLEQERSAPKTIIGLSEPIWPDLWLLDQQFNLPFVEGVHGTATFMPMRDGAIFDVKLLSSGLIAVPVNEQAREAVQFWD